MNQKLNSFGNKMLPALACIILFGSLMAGCAPATTATGSTPVTTSANATEPDYTGKKILFVNSYHQGYAWSDGIESGLREVLDGTGVEFKVFYMDTKNHPEESFGRTAGQKAKEEIDAFKPDVVITADDNSQKYLVVPYLKETTIPVVFNGVNWDATVYGYPTANITGMLEVELPDQMVNLLKAYATGERLGYITVDTETERKVVEIYNQRFFEGQMQIYWVKTQDEFKTSFLAAQQEVDILIMGNNAGSDVWDHAGMKKFVLNNTIIPTGSINDWMAPYSLLTLAKSAQEQGQWSAQAALSILNGTPVSDIAVAENKKGQLIVNLEIADKLGIVFAPSILKNAIILGE